MYVLLCISEISVWYLFAHKMYKMRFLAIFRELDRKSTVIFRRQNDTGHHSDEEYRIVRKFRKRFWTPASKPVTHHIERHNQRTHGCKIPFWHLTLISILSSNIFIYLINLLFLFVSFSFPFWLGSLFSPSKSSGEIIGWSETTTLWCF